MFRAKPPGRSLRFFSPPAGSNAIRHQASLAVQLQPGVAFQQGRGRAVGRDDSSPVGQPGLFHQHDGRSTTRSYPQPQPISITHGNIGINQADAARAWFPGRPVRSSSDRVAQAHVRRQALEALGLPPLGKNLVSGINRLMDTMIRLFPHNHCCGKQEQSGFPRAPDRYALYMKVPFTLQPRQATCPTACIL